MHLICSNIKHNIDLYIILYDTQEYQATFSTLTNLPYKYRSNWTQDKDKTLI